MRIGSSELSGRPESAEETAPFRANSMLRARPFRNGPALGVGPAEHNYFYSLFVLICNQR